MKNIIYINERGTMTIPKIIRERFPDLDALQIKVENEKIILEPLHFRDDFLEELERREQEVREGKTYSLDEVDNILGKRNAKRKNRV